MPRVSVIIPCYNHGIFIETVLNSVYEQTFKDYEIIIVNDGSSDTYTNKLFSTHSYPKVKVINIDHQGPSVARNIGISSCNGEYILPLDADDKIGSTYLEKAVKILDNDNKIGIVYCNAEFFGEKSGPWILPPFSPEIMVFENPIFNTAFFRKSDWMAVGGYNPNMIYGMEDYDFWISLINTNVKVYKINEILFYYRINKKSRSTELVKSRNHITDMYIQIFENHKDYFAKNVETLFYKYVSLELKKGS